MLCVTIARSSHKQTIAEHQRVASEGAQLAELRMDYIRRSVDLSRLLKDRPTPVVVTCRRPEDGGRWMRTEEERMMLLRSAIAMGVEYVDLEADTALKIPRYGKTKRIVSHHDFNGTPEDLESLHATLAKGDADIVKIAAQANSFADVTRIIDLMKNSKIPTIGISMGEFGTPSRILAMRYGAPFSYCAISSERKVAPGQLSFQQMRDIYRADSITPQTKLFGVVADPVAHSYSPLIHNAAFQAHELDYRYLPFRVSEEDLSYFIRWCQEEKIGGLSVTIPHKETIFPMLTQAESAAQGIGACNTVVFADGQTIGYNTDYRAAMDCITEAFTRMKGSENPFPQATALLLGSGGVSRAIGYGLAQRGTQIVVTSRNTTTTEELAKHLNGKPCAWDERHMVTADILVNGTPTGMFPDLNSTPYDTTKLEGNTLVFDTIYNPEQTLFIKGAKSTGCPIVTGLQMFVRQAAYQYLLFTGKEPPIDVMVKTLKRAITAINYKDLDDDDDEEQQVEEAT